VDEAEPGEAEGGVGGVAVLGPAGERGERERLGGERGAAVRERGVVIASGLMAGGALGGVFGAACRLIPGYHEEWIRTPFYGNDAISQSVSAMLFIALCCYLWFGSTRPREATE
jgi:hypothetical protein